MPKGSPTPGKDYIIGVDIIRFLSAVGVAAFHLTWLNPAATWDFPVGWIGVQLFFVISGLVIANSAHQSNWRRFARGRFLRLYPAAWCALLFNCLCISAVGAHAYELEGVFVTSAGRDVLGSFVLLGTHQIATAYWTLPVEIAFYVIVGLALAARIFENVERVAAFLILWSSFYLALLAFNPFGVMRYNRLHIEYGWTTVLLLRHGCYFGMGMLIWAMKERRLTRLSAAAFGAALLLSIPEIADRAQEIQRYMVRPEFGARFAPGALVAMSSCTFLCGVAAIVAGVRLNRALLYPPMLGRSIRLLGLATYPFYLLHEAVGGYVLLWLSSQRIQPRFGVWLAILIVGVLSIIIAAWLEPALRKLLERIASAGTRRFTWAYDSVKNSF